MKINILTEIKDIDGELMYEKDIVAAVNNVIKENQEGRIKSASEFIERLVELKGQPLTIKKIFVNCLLFKARDEDVDADESQRRFLVAQTIRACESFELDEKDREIIVKTMPKLYSIIVVGQVMAELKGGETTEAKKK